MVDEYIEMSREEIDDHRLEIENRIRNLFWTVSGDYTLDIKPDLDAFARSKYIALYDAVKQGAFVKQFDSDALSIYMMKKITLGGKQKPLLALAQLCVDAAVYPIMRGDRKGIDEVRMRAFTDLLRLHKLELKKRPDFFETVRMIMIKRFLEQMQGEDWVAVNGHAEDKPDQKMPDSAWNVVLQVADQIDQLSNAKDTDEIIATVDAIYNRFYDTAFEEKHGNLQAVLDLPPYALAAAAYEDCWSEELAEHIIQKFLRQQKKSLFKLEVDDSSSDKPGAKLPKKEFSYSEEDEQAAKKVADYVSMNYGNSYLNELERKRLNDRICRGIHRGCRLHMTKGILQAPVIKNYQYRMCQMQYEKNKLYYYGNHRVIKQNIKILAEMLSKAMVLRNDAAVSRARTGVLIPSRLWKVGRTDDDKLFDKIERVDSSDFVVDILLDSSGSQLKRQQQIAVQGYIISMALSAVGIPHRVTSFCTFWDYTVMQRFRDYDDKEDQNFNIFEYRASANNRDGLAIKATYDSLLAREEDHKILLVLSDGKPSDLGREHSGTIGVPPYTGEEAIRDTGFEIRRARAMGISVLGIFAGQGDDLNAEKRIYGKDFAYIRSITSFSHVVGTYLKKQLDED